LLELPLLFSVSHPTGDGDPRVNSERSTAIVAGISLKAESH
jgi:hypothetical protein